MKKKNKKILGVGFFILIAFALILFVNNQFFAVSTTCTPSGCPTGYTDRGVDCSMSGLSFECKRECYRPAGCSTSWSSWNSLVNSQNVISGQRVTSPWSVESSNSCYQYYAKTNVFYTTGTGKSVVSNIQDSWNTKASSCVSMSPVLSTTPIRDYGRGSNGDGRSAGGWYTTCGLTQVSTARVEVSINYKTAPYYATEDTKFLTCTGSVPCVSTSDCGTEGYTGSKYCSGDNVVQLYRTYSCSGYECQNSDNEQTIENCPYGCSGGVCNQAQCQNGEEKCEGTTSYSCSNYNWVSDGIVLGKCSVECTESLYQTCSDGSQVKIKDCLSNRYSSTGETCPSPGYIIQDNSCTYVSSGSEYSTKEQCEAILKIEETTSSSSNLKNIIIISLLVFFLFIGLVASIILIKKNKKGKRRSRK